MIVGVDVSYYQVSIDGSYPHSVFICRHSDGDFIDPRFATNWARATADPSIDVVVAYTVYRPASDAVQARRADRIRADTRGIGCAMVDAETWGGQIKGNQSGGLNVLWQLLTARYGGNPRRVWGYANAGDWASMWPQRPAMPTVLARYSNVIGSMPNMVAQQYSDGQAKYPVPAGLPRSSPPFGACDHNVFPAFTSGQQLAAWLGNPTAAATPATVTVRPIPTVQEDDMPTLVIGKNRGFGVIIGDQLVHLVDPASIDTAVAANFVRWPVSDVEWDNLLASGSGAGTIFRGPTGFAVQTAGSPVPHGLVSMTQVEHYRSAGYVEVPVDATEWAALHVS